MLVAAKAKEAPAVHVPHGCELVLVESGTPLAQAVGQGVGLPQPARRDAVLEPVAAHHHADMVPAHRVVAVRDRVYQLLVEGRRPHVRVAASIAEITGTRASYVESRGKSEEYCQALITDYLRKHGTASRLELNETVFPSLSSELTDSQKYDKVGNMLAKMRRSGTIVFDKRKSVWTLA